MAGPDIYSPRCTRRCLLPRTEIVLGSADRGDVARQVYDRAPNLSTKAYVLAWFGTFEARERKDPRTEIFPEILTRRLQSEIVTVLVADPSVLTEEPRIEFLVSVVESEDPASLADLVDDDDALRAMVDSSLAVILKVDTEGLVLGERTHFDPGIFQRLPLDRLHPRLIALRERNDLGEHERSATDAALGWISERRNGADS